MKELLFVTGGCRSGKSRFALDYANTWFKNKVFLATSQALDEEMERRIEQHRKARGSDWTTIEEPTNLAEALSALDTTYDVVLIDCLTIWISNLLMDGKTEEQIIFLTEQLVEVMKGMDQSIIVVSNEVGSGIVPENKIARVYRDIAGMVNQKVAACSDTVVLTVAGIPQAIKGKLR
jgi:adenosylcobinamide kinase/adenosylcobinamide-phosphate guanylyltransferase